MSVQARQKKLIPENAFKVLHSKEDEEPTTLGVLPQQGKEIKITSLTFFIAAGYATIRYNVFKGVAWNDWPTYTLNKVFGVTSLLLLVVAVIRYRSGPSYPNGKILYTAGLSGGIHVLLSVLLLDPVYYEKFFSASKLTFTAGLSMLLGTIAAVLFFSGAVSKADRRVKSKITSLVVICVLTALHTFLQGFETWFKISAWPGLLPPITMLASLAGILALTVSIISKRTLK